MSHSAQLTRYTLTGSASTGDSIHVRKAGVENLSLYGGAAERWGMVPDPQALSTVIRDGNYDFLTNSQHWHNTPGGFVIPSSKYLTSKPAFFGNNPWPWVDPTTGAIYTLPAKARYDAGTPNLN